ncbi:hypothetical protein [uncultured Enterococcus sp.]|uniref:hypothetical protein n=1 Tax=uncultured Enterococcus sp. TaxID=167972 RepID=UPI002AA7AB44|nr:hypothetical protein [uncultured Enterococcus sp.]
MEANQPSSNDNEANGTNKIAKFLLEILLAVVSGVITAGIVGYMVVDRLSRMSFEYEVSNGPIIIDSDSFFDLVFEESQVQDGKRELNIAVKGDIQLSSGNIRSLFVVTKNERSTSVNLRSCKVEEKSQNLKERVKEVSTEIVVDLMDEETTNEKSFIPVSFLALDNLSNKFYFSYYFLVDEANISQQISSGQIRKYDKLPVLSQVVVHEEELLDDSKGKNKVASKMTDDVELSNQEREKLNTEIVNYISYDAKKIREEGIKKYNEFYNP